MDDSAETKRDVGKYMGCRYDLADRQVSNRCERVGVQIERGWSCPRPFEDYVFKPVFNQLADARTAIDVRNDLEKIAWGFECSQGLCGIDGAVFVTHGACRNSDPPVV